MSEKKMVADSADTSFFEFLNAREAALQGAVGYFVTANVPAHLLREVAEMKSEVISLAAQVALYRVEKGGDYA